MRAYFFVATTGEAQRWLSFTTADLAEARITRGILGLIAFASIAVGCVSTAHTSGPILVILTRWTCLATGY